MTQSIQAETLQLALLVTRWHTSVLAQLDHLAEVPITETLEVTDMDTGVVKTISCKDREYFIQGLLVARTFFATLPFNHQQSE